MEMSRISGGPAPLPFGTGTERPQPFPLAADPFLPAGAQQAYLDALPIAAAILSLQEGEPRLNARNRLFARLLGATPDRSHMQPIMAELSHHLSGEACRAQFAWNEPGVGGRHFQVHLSRLAPDPERGAQTMVTLIDRTAEIETERSLRFEMLHDSLTGLSNRLAFTEAVETAIAEADGTPRFAVLALNLTRFSRVNESVGSLAGDELIITVARRLISVMRGQDMLARLGGDEFGILVNMIDGPEDALRVARWLQGALATPLRLSELEIRIDCAVGCALWHDPMATSADLMRNATFALKRAKLSGRVEVYQPGEVNQARRRFSLETELRRAIDGDQLSLAFQPLVELNGDRVAGFEALARWEHPDRGAIAPVEFITVAEESGLIVPLGRWVLDRASRALAEWDMAAGRELPFYISVNVSPVQLARDTVAAAVAAALGDHRIGGDRLTLELTESSIIADPDRAAGVLEGLKGLSCKVAMDDFGTGYSSLASLQRLPIDILKIDREFVSGMLDDRDSTAIIRAILSLAAALNMSTIAEGIESWQAARTLAVLGCTIGQGFHFAMPMTARDALAYYLDRAQAPVDAARRPAAGDIAA